MAKPTWRDLYLAVQGAEVLDAQKSARIAALEAGITQAIGEIKGLVYAVCLPMKLDDEELERKSERNEVVIALRALLNGGGK